MVGNIRLAAGDAVGRTEGLRARRDFTAYRNNRDSDRKPQFFTDFRRLRFIFIDRDPVRHAARNAVFVTHLLPCVKVAINVQDGF